MSEITIFLPTLAILNSLILLSLIRFLDVFEREPFKLVFYNFLFGLIAYLVSALFVSSISSLLDLTEKLLNSNNKFIFLSILITSGIMIISQIIFGVLSFLIFKKDFDSMPDYIVYFSSIGIGYNFGENFFYHLLNETTNPSLLTISDNLYFTSFFNGMTLPFIMAGIGAGIYLYKISKIKNFFPLRKVSYLIIATSFLTQILFYSMNFLILVNKSHSTTNLLDFAKEIKFFANGFSITLLLGALGFAVIFDAFIISNFFEKVLFLHPDKLSNFKYFSSLINPFSYLRITKFKNFKVLKEGSEISDKELRNFAKLALNNFNNPKNSNIYISEALNIFSDSKIQK
jgi:hypothetical protein